jgi:hypothetical protein
MLEPACECHDGHEEGQNWTSTEESRFIDEAVVAIEMLLSFAERACPKCDGCGKLLLQGGIVEADGIVKKPARIVCPDCRAKNPIVCDPESIEPSISTQGWNLTEEDNEFISRCLIAKAAITNVATAPLKPFVMPAEQ